MCEIFDSSLNLDFGGAFCVGGREQLTVGRLVTFFLCLSLCLSLSLGFDSLLGSGP